MSPEKRHWTVRQKALLLTKDCERTPTYGFVFPGVIYSLYLRYKLWLQTDGKVLLPDDDGSFHSKFLDAFTIKVHPDPKDCVRFVGKREDYQSRFLPHPNIPPKLQGQRFWIAEFCGPIIFSGEPVAMSEGSRPIAVLEDDSLYPVVKILISLLWRDTPVDHVEIIRPIIKRPDT